MLNSDLSPVAHQGGREPTADKARVVPTRRRVPTNRVSGRILRPSIKSVVANSFVPTDLLVDGHVSGLGTVHPLLTMDFFCTLILPLHVVLFSPLFCVGSPSAMELWMTGSGSGYSLRPLVHTLHVGDLDQMVAE